MACWNADCCRERIAKKKQKIQFVSEDLTDEVCDPSPSLEETILRKSDMEQFHKELNQLDEATRTLLIRKYFLSEPDIVIANDLNVKPNSVRTMLTRARRKLLQLLLNDGFDSK